MQFPVIVKPIITALTIGFYFQLIPQPKSDTQQIPAKRIEFFHAASSLLTRDKKVIANDENDTKEKKDQEQTGALISKQNSLPCTE